MGLRRTIKKILGYKEPEKFLNDSYSQEGEDLILHRIFEYDSSGFYVDVGAHHPARYSNTYKFYRLGWRGINIDAMPESMQLFNKMRPRDINLEIPVSDKVQTLPYYIFNEPALNTLSKTLADERNGKDNYILEKIVKIKTRTLAEILKEHLPENQKISFLTIDAEGYDFQILQSNDWNIFRPNIVLVESDLSFIDLMNSEMHSFMKSYEYELYAKTVRTYFFRATSFNI